jgi:hypothetical protein
MNPSRARRAFLIGLALFVLAQLGLAAAILESGVAVRDPAYGAKLHQLRKRLAASPPPLLAVQLGSSRTVCGLRGQVAEPWLSQRLGRPVVLFNMGIIAAGPVTNLWNLRRLLDEGVRPDLVLIEVLPRFLALEDGLTEPLLTLLPAHRLHYSEMRLLARHVAPHRRLEREWWQALIVPVRSYRHELLTRFAPTFVPSTAPWEGDLVLVGDESGWVVPPTIRPQDRPRCLAVARQMYGSVLRTFRLSPVKLDAVRETIALAHREGLAAALVLMPEGPTFRGWYPPAVKQQIDDALLALSRASAAPLLDLREGIAEEDFSDSHHLLPDSAAHFAHCLARRIEPLLHPEGRP